MRTLLSLAILLLGMNVLRADDDEEKVPLDKLPKVIVEAVKAKFPKGELVEATKEKEDGKTLFEVIVKIGESKIEVVLTEKGEIVEVEKPIDVKDLPKAVKEAIDAKYPKATLSEAEEVTKAEKIQYEVVVKTAEGKTLELTLDPAGKILETEEVKDEKKEDKKDK